MKKQIERLSPHQNGKVLGILMAVSSLILFVPFMLVASSFAPPGTAGPGIGMMLIIPVFYLVFTYLWVAVTCWLYNLLVKQVGGIEYETSAH